MLETPQKVSRYYAVSYKFVLKSVKSLIQICSVFNISLRLQTVKFGGRRRNYLSGKPRPSFKYLESFFFLLEFLLKSIKRLNRIFQAQEDSFKALQCQILSINTKSFVWESEAKLGTILKLSPILDFPINLFGSLSKA